MIVDLLVVLASLLILGAGSEVMRNIFDLIKEFLQFYKAGEIAGVAAEIVLYIILSFFQGILMFYAAMAIGQQFKSRIGGAVLAYIGIYVGTEIIRNIVSMILIFGFSEKWETFFDDSFTAIRTIMLLPIVWAVVLSIGCFIATRYFLTKRLNME